MNFGPPRIFGMALTTRLLGLREFLGIKSAKFRIANLYEISPIFFSGGGAPRLTSWARTRRYRHPHGRASVRDRPDPKASSPRVAAFRYRRLSDVPVPRHTFSGQARCELPGSQQARGPLRAPTYRSAAGHRTP